MKVIVDVDEKEFGKGITKETMTNVAQDIVNRYCNVEYYDMEELEAISNNSFGTDDIYSH